MSDYTDALALAKERWAETNAFDLEDCVWLGLFQRHGCPVVIESIRGQQFIRSDNPSTRYEFLLGAVERLSAAYAPSARIR